MHYLQLHSDVNVHRFHLSITIAEVSNAYTDYKSSKRHERVKGVLSKIGTNARLLVTCERGGDFMGKNTIHLLNSK